jgi:hypothetical protein
MSMQIVPARDVPANSRKARRLVRRCNSAVAAVGAGFFAISVSAFGADLGSGYSTAIAVPSHSVPAGRRLMQDRPIDPPDFTQDSSAQRAKMVDQFYRELMRWPLPRCSSTPNDASLPGAC